VFAAVVSFLLKYLVVALMLAVGLRTTPGALRDTWQQRGSMVRAFLVLEVGVPAASLLLVAVLPLRPLVAGLIALMAVCPGAPLVLRVVRGRAEVIVIAAIVALLVPVTVPTWLLLIERLLLVDLTVEPWVVLRIGLAHMLLPMAIGMGTALLLPRAAERLARIFWGAFTVSLVVAATLVVYLGVPLLLQARLTALAAVVLVVLVSLALGHWAGGPRLGDRAFLAQLAVLGNPALALAVVARSYPGLEAKALMAAYVLLRALALLPYQLLVRHRLRSKPGETPGGRPPDKAGGRGRPDSPD
jgi:BASS family bile acid:Na+ symporter